MIRTLLTLLSLSLSALTLAGAPPPPKVERVQPPVAGAALPDTANRQVLIPEKIAPGYLARLELNRPDELEATLKRVEEIYLTGQLDTELPPVTFIIHGPEAVVFLEENYDMYRNIIDLASNLTEKEVVDIKVCRNRLRIEDADKKPLQPFVGIVKFGPREVRRLRKGEGFEYFPFVDSKSR